MRPIQTVSVFITHSVSCVQ